MLNVEDVIEHNRRAWNRISDAGGLWSQPVSARIIESARRGVWEVSLAGSPIPGEWFGHIAGKAVLCLASGGGQQAPILAAAGAEVTSFDLSGSQLEKDEAVARREGLSIRVEQGSMTDLSRFEDASFDLVFLPVSLNSIPDVLPVWQGCHSILRDAGVLLAGFVNPVVYLFEENDGSSDRGLSVIHELPYSELESMSDEERQGIIDRGAPFEWSHALESLIGGQLDAGFCLTALKEARRTDARAPNLNRYCSTYIATRAVKC